MKEFIDWVFTEHPGSVGYAPAAVALALCVGIVAAIGIGGYEVVTNAL